MAQSLKDWSLEKVEAAKPNVLAFEAANPNNGLKVSLAKHGEVIDCYERICIAPDGRKSSEGISTAAAKALAAKCRQAGFEIKFDDSSL